MKKIIFALFTLLPLCVFASKPKIRQNNFCPGVNGQKIYMETVDSYFIIPDSDLSWKGIGTTTISDYYGTTGCMVVYAARKHDKKTAEWAKQQQSIIMNGKNNGKVYGTETFGRTNGTSGPGSLNFAFLGTLIIEQYNHQYRCANIIIGQGNTSPYNDWWVYSNYVPNSGYPSYDIQCTDITDPNNLVPAYFKPETINYAPGRSITAGPGVQTYHMNFVLENSYN